MNLVKAINDFQIEEAKLKLKASDEIYKKLLSGIEIQSVEGLGLRHTLYDNPISYLKPELGNVECHTRKGYWCRLTEMSLSDIRILAKFLNL
jgi:hypothetical protein